MLDTTKEYILCAAIHFNDGKDGHVHQPKNIESGFVITGQRHHNCFYTLHLFYEKTKDESLKELRRNYEDGFLTSKNRFVNRTEAARIALESGQIDHTNYGSDLFSEDLY